MPNVTQGYKGDRVMGVRLLEVSAQFIVDWLQSPDAIAEVVENSLPAGTKLLGVWCDPTRLNTILLRLEHPEWYEIHEGMAIPFIHPPPITLLEGHRKEWHN